jgi:hypothetical protein
MKTILKTIPVLKSKEADGKLYTAVSVRQYDDVSAVTFDVSWDTAGKPPYAGPMFFSSYISDRYFCRTMGGGGNAGNYAFFITVAPALPDDFAGLQITLKESDPYSGNQKTGPEIVIEL